MNIEEILMTYDAMFGNYDLDKIEKYLTDTIAKAKEDNETEVVVTLLNEIIGFCRDTTQKEKALLSLIPFYIPGSFYTLADKFAFGFGIGIAVVLELFLQLGFQSGIFFGFIGVLLQIFAKNRFIPIP